MQLLNCITIQVRRELPIMQTKCSSRHLLQVGRWWIQLYGHKLRTEPSKNYNEIISMNKVHAPYKHLPWILTFLCISLRHLAFVQDIMFTLIFTHCRFMSFSVNQTTLSPCIHSMSYSCNIWTSSTFDLLDLILDLMTLIFMSVSSHYILCNQATGLQEDALPCIGSDAVAKAPSQTGEFTPLIRQQKIG